MIHRLFITTLGLLTLANCQQPKKTESKEKITSSTKNTVTNPTTSAHTQTPLPTNNSAPKTSAGTIPAKTTETSPKAEQTSVTNKAGIIYLKEGENKFLKEYDMNVTFKQMKEDSRCPKDVNCVWAGVAIAEVEVMGTYTRPVTLQLSTLYNESRNYHKSQAFNGYTVSLVEVSPDAISTKGFSDLKGKYIIGLKLSKEDSTTPTTQKTGVTTK